MEYNSSSAAISTALQPTYLQRSMRQLPICRSEFPTRRRGHRKIARRRSADNGVIGRHVSLALFGLQLPDHAGDEQGSHGEDGYSG